MAQQTWKMPDGRSLGEYLMARSFVQEETHPRAHRQRQRHALERKWARATGTSTTVRAAFTAGAVPSAEIQALEDSIAVALGARKRNRWHNDRLLRDLAGPLTAAEMRGLYSPVPFGEPRRTAFAAAADPQHRDVWDMFRSIDPDRQRRVLDAWGQRGPRDKHAKAETRGCWGPAERWARVPRTQRAALRKAAPGLVAEIESTVLAAWRAPHPAGRVWAAPDAYHRLLAHGVAAFHGLRLAAVDDTTDGEGRGRALAVRGGREAPGPAGATVAALVAALQEGQAVLRPAEDVAAQEGAPLRLATACEAPAVDVQMEGHEAVVTQGGCFPGFLP